MGGSSTNQDAQAEEDSAAAGAVKISTKAKKPKGSKLFKQSKKDEGEGSGRGGKATTGSVEFWNEERARLGLKPLK